MAVVAIIAVDCMAVRSLTQADTVFGPLWGFGFLRMVNALAFAVVILSTRRRRRPFLWGFESFGAAAVASYLLWALSCPDAIEHCLVFLLAPLLQGWGVDSTEDTYGPILMASFAVLFLLLQLAFGLIGGFLSR